MNPLRPSIAPLLAGLLILMGCGGQETPRTDLPTAGFDGTGAAVDASNALAWDLYAPLGRSGGNLFFSPASIELALSMAYTGARGGTAAEMRTALHLEALGEAGAVGRAFGALQADLMADQPGDRPGGHPEIPPPYTLRLANSLWGQEGFSFRGEFLAGLRDGYGAPLQTVDFLGAPESARGTINQWVGRRTEDRIPELFPAGSIDNRTRLVLANAIYFLGRWQDPFKGRDTGDRRFHLDAASSVHLPTMTRTGPFPYAETEAAQILALPYAGRRLAMIVVLPREVEGLATLEAELSNATLQRWTGSLTERRVKVHLPKFSLEGSFNLNRTLSEQGMPSAFGSGADFSGMTSAGDLAISQVVHKSFIDVYEEGTEAAAATGMSMMLTSLPREDPDLVRFIADHPFLFFIQDRHSGLVLFLGRVMDPRG